jgi:hypothetical protein
LPIYRCQTASQVSLFVGFLISWISLHTKTTKIGTLNIRNVIKYIIMLYQVTDKLYHIMLYQVTDKRYHIMLYQVTDKLYHIMLYQVTDKCYHIMLYQVTDKRYHIIVSLFVGFLISWISLHTKTTKIGTQRIKVICAISAYHH